LGQEQFRAFTKVSCTRRKSIDDPIYCNKLKLFSSSSTEIVTKGKQQLTSMMSDVALFSRLYTACRGRVHLGTSDITCLEDNFEAQSETLVTSTVIIDGAAIVQMKNQLIQKRSMIMLIGSSSHNLFYSYKNHPAWTGVGYLSVPLNWQNFLCKDNNKTELFAFLTNALFQSPLEEGKEVVITDWIRVLTKPELRILICLPFAATKRQVNACYYMLPDIMPATVTSRFLFAQLTMQLSAEDELWEAAHQMAACLGPGRACVLPMFHTLTGCDMVVSRFPGHGKKTA
ncbi:hypothetical protein Hamer_G006072, partial [Homarus americanus]